LPKMKNSRDKIPMASPNSASGGRKNLRILVADDSVVNQKIAQLILEKAGYHVDVVENGHQAVEICQRNHYDLILMDIQMPYMDGHEATRQIRAWELEAQSSKLKKKDSAELSAFSFQPSARAKRVPIIAMTAHALAGDEDKSLAAGMNGHVTKPIDPDQLFAALAQWIKLDRRKAVAGPADAASEASPPQQPKLSEDDLPESLPGFDLAVGLRRLMGNKRLYRKLLLDFGGQYTQVAAELRQALDAGDFVKSHSLVHNLKGLAGNLAAVDLQAAAIEMEKWVKGDQARTVPAGMLNQKFLELEKALDRALAAVQAIGPAAAAQIFEPSADALATVPADLINEMADRLRAAVEMGDVTQVGTILAEMKSRANALAPVCDRLSLLAADFDFDGMLKLVEKLASIKEGLNPIG
jgi:two-component system sensor histidine kinase/response regulator